MKKADKNYPSLTYRYYCEEEKVYLAETGYIISPVGTRSYRRRGGGGQACLLKY